MDEPRLYPEISLGEKQWLHVVAALRKSGTKRDATIADNIEKQVAKTRARSAFLMAARS